MTITSVILYYTLGCCQELSAFPRPMVCFRFFGGLPPSLAAAVSELGIDVAEGAVPPQDPSRTFMRHTPSACELQYFDESGRFCRVECCCQDNSRFHQPGHDYSDRIDFKLVSWTSVLAAVSS